MCGIGIVRDYYRLQKFNVMEIAKTEQPGFKKGEGRMEDKNKMKVAEEVAKDPSELKVSATSAKPSEG